MFQDHPRTYVLMALFLILSIIGCSGGGDDDDASPPPDTKTLEVSPSSYDFGTVTFGNSPTPLKIKITNTGTEVITIHDIVLSDSENFALVLDGEPTSCNTNSPVIAAGQQCSVEVSFQPSELGTFEAALNISSDSQSSPTTLVDVRGIYEPESNLTVSINQVESDGTCPAANMTAYVSVLDQGGYPVKGLLENNFSISENGTSHLPLTDFSFAAQVNTPLTVALVMDYSGSITDNPENVNDMQDAVAEFIRQLGISDEAEIIKFDSKIEVVQGYTSDKAQLINALYAFWDNGRQTSLYDAVAKAIQDTTGRDNPRRAVIVITDGEDKPEQLGSSLDDVITSANTADVPIFTIGLGQINDLILQQMAADTGGQFYKASISDNLGNVYRQLTDLLFENQYILTYVSGLDNGESAELGIKVVSQTNSGEDTRRITPCP